MAAFVSVCTVQLWTRLLGRTCSYGPHWCVQAATGERHDDVTTWGCGAKKGQRLLLGAAV